MNVDRRLKAYIGSLTLLAVLLLTTAVFSNSIKNGFIKTWDDNAYILDNPHIKDLSLQSIWSIFSTFYAANYHPLTTLSWALEYHLFGLNASVYHITNLAFHLLNTILVFRLIFLITRKLEVSAIVALFFAIHPLHVETVSFISQRKDVLYTCFYLASLIIYVRYIREDRRSAFLIMSFLFFLCSILCKSMAVTLPVVLLLIDYYWKRPFTWKGAQPKIPFFALSLVFGIIAILSQKAYGAIIDLPSFSLLQRVFLVSYAFVFYVFRVLAPLNLSAMYYYPTINAKGMLPLEYYAAPVFIILMVWGVLKTVSFRKELIFGLGFYLITISLVLQIIPVGSAIVAERYTYVPYIGLFFIIGQFYSRITANGQYSRTVKLPVLFVLIAYTLFFSVTTWNRNKVWANSFTLWSDVIEKNPRVTVAYYNRGVAKFNAKDYQGAVDDYSKAVQLKPDYAEAYNNRGESKVRLQDCEGALKDFDAAIAMKADYAHAYFNRANLKNRLKNYGAAIDDFNKTLSMEPHHVDTHFNRAYARSRLQDHEGALHDLSKVIELRPGNAVAYNNRGIAKAMLGDYRGAIDDFNKAIKLRPDYMEAHNNRERVRSNVFNQR
jgi:tetratricopeptide (TPR) repeat protein